MALSLQQTCRLTCLLLSCLSGLVCNSFPELPVSYIADMRDFYIPMQIENRVYSSSLLDSSSTDFGKLYKEVNELLDRVYGCEAINPSSGMLVCPTHKSYDGVAYMTFRSASVGVIANATVMFDTNFINSVIVKSIFLLNYDRYPQLKINETYTDKSPPHHTDYHQTTKGPTTTVTTTPTTTVCSCSLTPTGCRQTDYHQTTTRPTGCSCSVTPTGCTPTTTDPTTTVTTTPTTTAPITGPYHRRPYTTTVTPTTSFYIPMQIENRVYSSSLLDSSSTDFGKLYQEVNELLDRVYDICEAINPSDEMLVCPKSYGGVVYMTFRSASVGVIANATVMFDTNYCINSVIVKSIFLLNYDRYPQLKINDTYTVKSPPHHTDYHQTTGCTPTTTVTTPTTTPTTTVTTTGPTTTVTPTTFYIPIPMPCSLTPTGCIHSSTTTVTTPTTTVTTTLTTTVTTTGPTTTVTPTTFYIPITMPTPTPETTATTTDPTTPTLNGEKMHG